jgi:Zn-dependent protease
MPAEPVQAVLTALLYLVPMILSLTVHEFAHAAAARALGDDTAQRQGRLTLNPIAHIDPVGTILVPLALRIFSGGALGFGWAKPVEFDVRRVRRGVHPRTASMLVAGAGPASNLVLATICFGIHAALFHTDTELAPAMHDLLIYMIVTNIGLAVFNMIPVYPLDGQKVLSGLLPTESAIAFERFNYQYGTLLIIGVLVFARDLMRIPVMLIVGGLGAVFGM